MKAHHLLLILSLAMLTACSSEKRLAKYCPCQKKDCANCVDFEDQRQIRKCYRATLQVYGYDYHHLDRNRNHKPCEKDDKLFREP